MRASGTGRWGSRLHQVLSPDSLSSRTAEKSPPPLRPRARAVRGWCCHRVLHPEGLSRARLHSGDRQPQQWAPT